MVQHQTSLAVYFLLSSRTRTLRTFLVNTVISSAWHVAPMIISKQ
jgi:hypothetical protein